MADKKFPDDYSEKTSIVDNDQFAVADSAASDAFVNMKYSTVKTAIATDGNDFEVNSLGFSAEYVATGDIVAATPDTLTIDWSNGNCQMFQVPADDLDLTFSNPVIGTLLIRILHDGTSRDIDFQDTVHLVGVDGTTTDLTLDGNAAHITILTIYYDGTSYYCSPTEFFA